MNNLDEKYDKNNWITWQELLSKYYGEKVENKCKYCQFATSDEVYPVCIATYYGKKLYLINDREKEDCDYTIEFSLFMELGEKKIDKEFTDYIYRG